MILRFKPAIYYFFLKINWFSITKLFKTFMNLKIKPRFRILVNDNNLVFKDNPHELINH
jgi:predicted CDP-diglyceride synthetase/phosphatidate cytidylyltransferase